MYYECHITLGLHPKTAQYAIEMLGWKYSLFEGDPGFGPGSKEYATRNVSANHSLVGVIAEMAKVSDFLKFLGFNVLRQKVEIVVYDTKGKENK